MFPDVSMEAIRLIRQCADYVALKPEVSGLTNHSIHASRPYVHGTAFTLINR